ncbi:M1 family metallopeptidase [Aestuariivivens sp. NBU2969]|uniref:M1 family metallopeptidase n=1 Tax=Aestuariivivens sp. NBU2969 TaxID=2873267 RepID=UPI001CC00BC1|nr:M1 family metallopeptidase [Aestuariivivens sp. NBU2969]
MKLLLQWFCYFFTVVCFAQQTEYVDFKTAKADIGFDVSQNKVYGEVSYVFNILNDIDSIYLDAVDMRIMRVRMLSKNNKSDFIGRGEVVNDYDGKKVWLMHEFKKGQAYKLNFFFFKNNPKKALYFIDWEHEGRFENLSNQNRQIWTQGQGKYTSNWLPSIDDMNDKIEFDLSITFDSDYEVIANGKLTNKQINESTITWHYDMLKPMSSYLVALVIGKYDKKVAYSKSGIPLEMYFYPEDSNKVEPTYRYTKRMFDFLEEEIGVLYPWQNYKQVPVKDFLYAGMENTGTTIFSDSFVIDSIAFVDKNYVNVNAHELAHQWFGDLITETSGTHHWLQEGFATYYALLAERDIFGEDYYYWRLYEYAQELLEQDKAGQSTSLLDPKSSSTTFYKKGAWVLHLLREKVGDEAFRKAVKNYLQKHQFKNVETNDFISEVEKTSGENLDKFAQETLVDTESFRLILMKRTLGILTMQKINSISSACKTHYESLKANSNWESISKGINDFSRIKVFQELWNDSTINKTILAKSILNTNDLKVRQAIAQTLVEIPLDLKIDYESLLNDKSYITIEAALYNLWRNFPEDRTKYLIQTEDIIGFNNKNIRVLWLTLTLVTPDFEPENKQMYFEELRGYTDAKYHFEVRQNAFQYLSSIKACDAVCKENLEQAAKYHVWQFSKFAKQLLKEID